MGLNKKGVALALGSLLGLFHAVWALLVWVGVAQRFYDWILSLHFISLPLVILPFHFWTAVLLVIVTFVVGYVMGWVFAAIWNKLLKR
jgi:hypothetical protein